MRYITTILAALLTVMEATTATARSREIPTNNDPSGARSVVSLLRPANPQTSGADHPTTGADNTSSMPTGSDSSKLPAASALPVLAAKKSTNKRTRSKSTKSLKSSLQRHINEIKSMAANFMSLSLYDRAILLIKHFETMHHPRHWPYVGYGHQVQPSDPYRRGVQLTEAQADALLRKDFNKFCSMYRHMGRDSVICAALAYNCGPGVVNKSTFYKKLKNGNRDIAASYAVHCRYRGKPHQGLKDRRLTDLLFLFVP